MRKLATVVIVIAILAALADLVPGMTGLAWLGLASLLAVALPVTWIAVRLFRKVTR